MPSTRVTAVTADPTVRALLAVVLFTYTAQNMLNVSVAPLARELQLPEWSVGAAVSVAALTVAALSQFWGRRAVAWGPRRVILLALSCAFVAGILFSLAVWARSIGALGVALTACAIIISRGPFFGAAVAAIPPTGQVLVAQLTDTEAARIRGMASFSGAINVSIMIGSMVSSLLALWWIDAPVHATPWFVAIALLIAWFALPKARQGVSSRSTADEHCSVSEEAFGVVEATGSVAKEALGVATEDRTILGKEPTEVSNFVSARENRTILGKEPTARENSAATSSGQQPHAVPQNEEKQQEEPHKEEQLPRHTPPRKETRAAHETPAALPPRVAWNDARILPWMLGAFGIFFATGVTQILAGFIVQDRLALTPQEAIPLTAVLLMSHAVGAMLMQLVVVPRLAWTPAELMRRGVSLGFIFLIVLTFATQLWLLIVVALTLGVASGLVGPGFSAGGSLAVSAAEQGGVAGVLNATGAVTWIFAPVSAAAMYGWHPLSPFALAVAILAVSVAVVWFHPRLRGGQVGTSSATHDPSHRSSV
ncbi:MFS transporter [Schaalia suimastitidis]|uniref:MFS transporter n=1 Tax=Schaalia suimastitidis TaxID=121163 RepID=UPI000417C0F9|nr:MFS transporter [Schaalia suimastitidis]